MAAAAALPYGAVDQVPVWRGPPPQPSAAAAGAGDDIPLAVAVPVGLAGGSGGGGSDDEVENNDNTPLLREPSAGAQCRVCFEGRSAGILFKPCLCDGSMKYIHVGCLEQWRRTNIGNARTTCPNCHYRYRFNRINHVAWMSHPAFVTSLTLAACMLLEFSLFSLSKHAIVPLCGGGLLTYLSDPSDAIPDEQQEVSHFFDALLTSLALVALLGYVSAAVFRVESPAWADACCRCCCNGGGGRRGRRHGTHCNCGGGGRGAGIAGSGLLNCCQCVFAVVIIVGVAVAIWTVYCVTERIIRRGRDQVQEYILDIRDSRD